MHKRVTTVTNPRSETVETQNIQPSGSKIDRSIGVRASNTKNSDSENEDYLLRDSGMKDLRHPAKHLYRSGLDLNAKIVSNEDAEEEDYHSFVFLAFV